VACAIDTKRVLSAALAMPFEFCAAAVPATHL
jgi:hypothetical protein